MHVCVQCDNSQRQISSAALHHLKSYFVDNFMYPYPSDADKEALSLKTGLTINQVRSPSITSLMHKSQVLMQFVFALKVSNWFINVRGRFWRPMIKEVQHRFQIKLSAERDIPAPIKVLIFDLVSQYSELGHIDDFLDPENPKRRKVSHSSNIVV
jgi:hypothetical protein